MGVAASSEGRTLVKAIKANDQDSVRRILEEQPNSILYTTFWKNDSPLILASQTNNILTVSTLLYFCEQTLGEQYSAYVNYPNSRGNTAIYAASKRGLTTVLRILLEEGASPLPANRRGETALHIACQRGHATCVELLLDAPIRSMGGATPIAAHHPVRDIVGESRYIDATSNVGFAPLHWAVYSRCTAAVSALVQRGALLDVPVARGVDRMPFLCGGSTPLHIAAAQGDLRTCVILLEGQWRHPGGVDLRRVRNMLGLTPLNCALLGGHQEIVRVLVDMGRRGSGSGAGAAAIRRRIPSSVQVPFPNALRLHMLAVLRRASLLIQLQQIAITWNAAGIGLPQDTALIQVPGLKQLSMKKIARLQRMLRRQDTSLRDVLFGLESALRPPPGNSDGDDDSEEEEDVRNNGVASPGQSETDAQRSRRSRALARDVATALGISREQMRSNELVSDVASIAGQIGFPRRQPGSPPDYGLHEHESVGYTPGGDKAVTEGSVSEEEVEEEEEDCQICMDCLAEVSFQPCTHRICFQCACRLCMRVTDETTATCPFCRRLVEAVEALPGARMEIKKGGAASKAQGDASLAASTVAV